jgi:GT2 family glycosyltransferase/predicted Zn-dependent protease
MRRYLFGPVSKTFADQNLCRQRQAGECLAFDLEGAADLAIGPADNWAQVCTRLPAGWRPDFIVLYLPYAHIPTCLWQVPVPLVGLALDWPLLWHYYRRRLRSLDWVLTDSAGVETLAREGILHARAANLHGCERRFAQAVRSQLSVASSTEEVSSQPPVVTSPGDHSLLHTHHSPNTDYGTLTGDFPRDIDILFVGNLNPAVQPGRLRMLDRLARLGRRWRVSIQTGIFGDAYYRLLCRARIVVNHVCLPRSSRRIFEVANAGALLFENTANTETMGYFRDRQECVFYDPDSLEPLLEHYLENEEERRKLAEAAQTRARAFTFENLWGTVSSPQGVSSQSSIVSSPEDHPPVRIYPSSEGSLITHKTLLQLIEEDWPTIVDRFRRRVLPGKTEELMVRTWQALIAPFRADAFLVRDLEAAMTLEPGSGQFRQGLALAIMRLTQDTTTTKVRAEVAAELFRQVVSGSPANVLARLNLAEALAAAEHLPEAIEQARQALAMLERSAELDPSGLDVAPFHADFGVFRLEWERAAWMNAGQPAAEARAKRDLLRWRLHALLGKWTGKIVHYYEAYLSRPDMPACSSALGCTLASGEHALEAVPYLRRGLGENPFDRDAARALIHVLHVAQDGEAAKQLTDDRRLLSRAAPQVLSAEPWFSDPPPSVHELASIVVLCCNQLEFTRQCLESVRHCTRTPYELILVDNGSADGTREYLEQVRSGRWSEGENWRNGDAQGQRNRTRGDGDSAAPPEPSKGVVPFDTADRSPFTTHQSSLNPIRVEVIRNEINRGFPAGCNQALARARGRFLVFLNNDTVVTPSWLETLIARSLDDWPSIGLVGAVTNNAPDAQGIAADYPTLDALPPFAERRRRAFAGKVLPVRRLTGFCLLVRREVFDRIGRFDERFGVGFFDDDDLCLRAREAGFRLVVALDVYVHHFGSQTFNGLALDTRQQLLKNFALFRAKWGEEHVAGYRLIGPPPTAEGKGDRQKPTGGESEGADLGGNGREGELEKQPSTPMTPFEDPGRAAQQSLTTIDPPLTNGDRQRTTGNGQEASDHSPLTTHQSALPGVCLCMIVKNEENHLGPCLDSAADLFDEIVIVDTGSADRTKEIAGRYGARLADFPWADSFSAARNEGLRHATRRWIMWLDADDRLDEINRTRLRELFRSLGDERDAYAMKVRSVLDAGSTAFRLLDQVRLFPNHPHVRWDYRVHEQTLPAVLRAGGRVRWADVVIDHVGYQRSESRRTKLERNLRLLELDNVDRPDDPFTLFNLGWTLLDLGKTEEALPRLQRSLEKSAPDSSITRKLYHLVALTHKQLGQKEQARAICRAGLERFPDDTELLVEEALLQLDNQEFSRAEVNLLQLVEARPGQYFGSVDDGMRGYRTRDLLARQYRTQGRLVEAEIHWRAAIVERSSFLPAWLGLADLFLSQRRHSELTGLAAKLEREPGGDVEAAILRARAHRDREEFSQARQILEPLISRLPKAEGPRVLLSHLLLQEGRDLVTAENVLRQILRLNPLNAEARHNLKVLLGKQGRSLEVEEASTERRGQETHETELEPCLAG